MQSASLRSAIKFMATTLPLFAIVPAISPVRGDTLPGHSAGGQYLSGRSLKPGAPDGRESVVSLRNPHKAAIEKGALRFGPGLAEDRAFIKRIRAHSFNAALADFPADRHPKPDDNFQIAYVDMNGDGRKDMFVTYQAAGFCGSGGCDTELFIAQPDGGWKSVYRYSANLIKVLRHKTLGYLDFINVGHTGNYSRKTLDEEVFRWNGQKYVTADKPYADDDPELRSRNFVAGSLTR